MMTLNKVLLYARANFERGKGCRCAWSSKLSDPASATVASVLSATKTCEDTLALRTDMMIKVLQVVLRNAHVCLLAEHLHYELKAQDNKKNSCGRAMQTRKTGLALGQIQESCIPQRMTAK